MSILGFLFGNKNQGTNGSNRIYIIDGVSLGSPNGNRNRLVPKTQMDMLRRLSRFGTREKVELYMVFEGRPLRQAPDKKKYQDVMVYYAPKTSDMRALIVKLFKSNSRGGMPTVITSDKEMEKDILNLGGATLRTSTFRKALDPDGGRDEGSSSRRRSGRRPSQNKQRKPQAKQQKKVNESSKSDSVSEMIDLVE